ncbi:glycosyltransferase family 2 protein [Candidatus Bathyarchaeota archaeon]|nr:MAG: glycosyltransferase family 2 protein [Candidatus Bathyarchaeota archaeon]
MGGEFSDKVCVVIPAFNEEDSIYEVVKKALGVGPGIKVIVVDDGSTDMTAELAEKAGAQVIRHSRNVGQWEALRTGFREALRQGFSIVISMDGDGQHDPKDIPSLVEPIASRSADLVIGSRMMGGRTYMLPYRYAGIRFFSLVLSFLTGSRLTDVLSGFRAYRSGLLKAMLGRLRERQYGVLEATLVAWRLGARIIERPVGFTAKRISKKGSLRFFFNLCRVLIRSLLMG